MPRLDRPVPTAARRFVDRFPPFLVAAYRLRYRSSRFLRRVLGPDTAVMIEGFPRSGNSFANRAFQHANPELSERIATHVHLSAHVIQAAGANVPTIVPFRHPQDCLPSLYALRRSVDEAATDPKNLDTWLRDYIAFSERVSTVGDRVVLVPFDQLTTDYGAVIDRVNVQFGTSFVRFDHNEHSVAEVFSTSGTHLSPSEARGEDKARGRTLYNQSSARLRQRAERSYAALIELVPEDLWGADVAG